MSTIFTKVYNKHSIRIDNTIFSSKLYIDGVEKDCIKGVSINSNVNALYGRAIDGQCENLVECSFKMKYIKKKSSNQDIPIGLMYEVKFNNELIGTGYVSKKNQKKADKQKSIYGRELF